MLEVRDLVKEFGGLRAVDGVSFTLAAHTITGLIGPNGAGKTTLFNTIAGAHRPTSGSISFAGQAIGGLPPHRIFGAGLVRTFQIPRPFAGMTVLENVMLPLQVQGTLPKDQHEARALEALEWVGMAEARDRLPADLSGGMKKRVGLARAIVARPHLLFLDEPSAGLDPISSVKLDRLILDIRERTEAAIVIVTHELPSIYALADDGIFLDADLKRPIAHGKPTQMRDTVMHPTVQAFMRRQEIDTL